MRGFVDRFGYLLLEIFFSVYRFRSVSRDEIEILLARVSRFKVKRDLLDQAGF
jgi:hypothetical protein